MAKTARQRTDSTVTAVLKPDLRQSFPAITHDDIARRAFELFCDRGCRHGYDVEDWLQAERELTMSS